jgi:hypothetical protein
MSWVVRNKATGEALFETYDKRKVDALNTVKYEAAPIQRYLGSIAKRCGHVWLPIYYAVELNRSLVSRRPIARCTQCGEEQFDALTSPQSKGGE